MEKRDSYVVKCLPQYINLVNILCLYKFYGSTASLLFLPLVLILFYPFFLLSHVLFSPSGSVMGGGVWCAVTQC